MRTFLVISIILGLALIVSGCGWGGHGYGGGGGGGRHMMFGESDQIQKQIPQQTLSYNQVDSEPLYF